MFIFDSRLLYFMDNVGENLTNVICIMICSCQKNEVVRIDCTSGSILFNSQRLNTWEFFLAFSWWLYYLFSLQKDISKLTEDKKEGLRQLAMTFQHFMREEIQDASQLPPSFDLFEAFAKVSLKLRLLADAVSQSLTLCFLVICKHA